MSEPDHNATAQFNFVGQQNVLQQEPSRPGSSRGKQPDLSLSLGRQDTSGLLRSTSLASSLAINERAPPPPRDFLSLSRSYSLPTGTGLQHHDHHQQLQHHNLARWHQQAEAPLLEYQKRRLLEQQRSAREHPILPSTQRHHQVPIMQQQVTALQQPVPVQQWNQQVVVLPQNQAVVLPQALHHHLQQQSVVVVPPPTPQQLPQQQVFVMPPSQVLPASSPPNVAAAVASATTNPALSRALGHIAPQTGQSSGATNTPAEGNCSSPPNRSTRSALNGIAKSRAFRLGSSNSTSAPMEVAPVGPATQAANNRGKQPPVPRSDNDPLPISSSEKTDSESVAKKMRLMKEMGLEDGLELLKQMPGVAYKAAEMKRTEGFLYRYREGEISIVCNCHGTFLTPAEFVEHAGGADVDNPMKHITICSNQIP